MTTNKANQTLALVDYWAHKILGDNDTPGARAV